MHFYNKTFENTYLNLISEQANDSIFKYICNTCNTGFTENDGFAENDKCPCEDCDGVIEKCIIDKLDPNNMPSPYSDTNGNDESTDEDSQDEDEDFQDEDEDLCDLQDEDEDLCDLQDEDEDLQDEDEDLQDEDEDLQDEDEDLQDEDEDFQDEDEDLQDEDEDFQDEDEDEDSKNADDQAANEDTDQQNQEPVVKLVSFTTEDTALVQLLNQVQNGEIKLVAVPVDFTFDEDEMNEQPAITSDTVGNFAIEDINDEQDEQNESDEESTDDDNEADNDEKNDKDQITKESKKSTNSNCAVKTAKSQKYGIY